MPDKSFLSWPFFEDSHRSLASDLRVFCKQHIAGIKSHDLQAAREFIALLGEAGWLKLTVPAAENSQAGFDVRSLAICRETLAFHSGLADCMFAMQGLGAGPISLFGSKEQKQKYLPGVASGKTIAAFALSEAEAGSDVAALAVSARRDGDFYVLNGEKTWISNAGIADLYVVFARTGEHAGAKGLSAFIVEGDTPGLNLKETIECTAPHPLGTISLLECRIPAGNLIGQSGRGFQIAMATLDVFRTTVGAAALGFARRAFDEALKHAESRELFGQKLSDFQLTQAKIADMSAAIDASALLIYRAAWTKDRGAERITREASLAKFYATESAQHVIDQALQLLGGQGVVRDSVLETLYRDIRPLRIYEGTSEVQKLIIARQAIKDFQESEQHE